MRYTSKWQAINARASVCGCLRLGGWWWGEGVGIYDKQKIFKSIYSMCYLCILPWGGCFYLGFSSDVSGVVGVGKSL